MLAGHTGDRGKDVVKVDPFSLGESLGDEAGLVAEDFPVGVSLDLEDPFAANGAATFGELDQLVGSLLEEQGDLLLHCYVPLGLKGRVNSVLKRRRLLGRIVGSRSGVESAQFVVGDPCFLSSLGIGDPCSRGGEEAGWFLGSWWIRRVKTFLGCCWKRGAAGGAAGSWQRRLLYWRGHRRDNW